MQINQSVFKSYDIRGIYPSELNEQTAFQIGRGFVKKTGAKNMVMGYDARLSSPALLKAFAAGAGSEGVKIYNIGQVLTECVYFSVGNYDFDAGVMVTASHNPKEYGGFKMVKKKEKNLKVISGKDLLPAVKEKKYEVGGGIITEEKDIWYDYIKHIFSFVDLSRMTPFRVVVDASNGVAGLAILKIREKLPIEIIPLNFEPDGNFPNHTPNPMLKEASVQIGEEIRKQKADFGFIFDGDADRIFLVDETGKLISSDPTILLLAKHFLKKAPGMGIARHVTCSKAIPEFIEKWGGKPIRTKVGFIHIQQGLIENNGIMGGELTGHYCFKDNFYSDSGMIAFLTLLQIISEDSRKVSEIAKEFSPYYKPSEINFEIKNKEKVLEKIKQKYADGKQDYLDGVTVEYRDWWFNVRLSNTEPLLRLTIEADNQDIFEEKKKEIKKLIA